MSPAIGDGRAALVDLDTGHGRAGRVGQQARRAGVRLERDVGMRERGPDTQHLGIRLGLDQAREPVAGRAPDTAAVGHVVGQQPDPAGRMERMQAGTLQVIRQLLDARLMGQRRIRIRRAGRAFGRVLAPGAVDLVHLLRGGVPGLHLGVADGPRGRDAVVMLEDPEVLGTQSIQGGAVQLGRATDPVVDARLERLAVLVVPGLLWHVLVVHEHDLGVPVLGLAWQPVAALQDQDALAGRGELVSQGAAAGTAADDDDVVVAALGHGRIPSSR